MSDQTTRDPSQTACNRLAAWLRAAGTGTRAELRREEVHHASHIEALRRVAHLLPEAERDWHEKVWLAIVGVLSSDPNSHAPGFNLGLAFARAGVNPARVEWLLDEAQRRQDVSTTIRLLKHVLTRGERFDYSEVVRLLLVPSDSTEGVELRKKIASRFYS